MPAPLLRWYSTAAVALSAAAGFAAVALPVPQAAVKPEDAEFFESRIRPVLAENCFSCHGDPKQSGGFRLDSPAFLSKAGIPLVVPGDPSASRLIRAVEQTGAIKMPPAGKLKPNEIADLTEWVRRGAPWPAAKPQSPAPDAHSATFSIKPEQRAFWSFQPVRRPAVPQGTSPNPLLRKEGAIVRTGATYRRAGASVASPIDSFVVAGLRQRGLTLNPPADRRTLIRRAAYDLTGLPPTPEEVDAFVKDPSANAWEKVIDRLLASPRYGERWGRHWLDLVRYCDSLDSRSLGSEGDISEAWRYRDWVIGAFNSDLPYTDFIIQQVAGDVAGVGRPATRTISLGGPATAWASYRLPNADGIIATSMLSIGNWGNGDADKDKILTDIADDQLDVVSRTFMGLTLGCARCHNHKFDPLSQADYYAMAGMFFSTHILAHLAAKGAGESIMKVPLFKPELVEARKKYAADVAALESKVNAVSEEARRAVAAGMLPETERYMTAAWEYRLAATGKPEDFAAQRGLRPYALRQWLDFQGPGDFPLMTTPVRDVLGSKSVHAFRGGPDTPSAVVNTNAEPRQLLTFTLPPHSVSVHPGPTTGVAILWSSPLSGVVTVTGKVADADPAGGDGIAWVLGLRSGTGLRTLASGGFENGGTQGLDSVGVNVNPGDRIELHVLPKMSHTCDTTAVELRIAAGGKVWDLTKDVVDNFHEGGNPHPDSFGSPGVWRFVDMAGKPGTLLDPKATAALARWRELLAKPRAEDRQAALDSARTFAAAFKLADASSPFWPSAKDAESALAPEARQRVAALTAELDSLRKNAPQPLEYANGAQEGGVPESPHEGVHDVRVHLRGRYDRLAELVPRRFPTILAGEHQPTIKSGSGRLELAEWLASPTHPLTARVLVNRLWQHHFGEGIVRTPSNFGFLGERPTNPALLEWLASEFMRGSWSIKRIQKQIMLSATYQQSSKPTVDALRIDPDNRLFGRMNRRRLEAEEVRDSLLAASGKLDATMGGPAVRDMKTPRRTVYVMTVRSDRTGFGPLFDMADSTNLVDRRNVSTVAPQALFLLNDLFALEQARALAKRLSAESKGDVVRIGRAYLLLYGRPALPEEVRIGQAFLAKAHSDPTGKSAGASSGNVEESAWTAYSQILLSANEFMYVD
jgi:mono/diheme cytochrome c family protein